MANLKLYQALEQRREYKRIIKTFEKILPENRTDRWGERKNERPIKNSYIEEAEQTIKTAKIKLHKLNEAIQVVNRNNTISIDKEPVSIATALELRKELLNEIYNLEENLAPLAYYEINYKSGGDNEKIYPIRDYEEMRKRYLKKLKKFREINFELRKAQYHLEVDFQEE